MNIQFNGLAQRQANPMQMMNRVGLYQRRELRRKANEEEYERKKREEIDLDISQKGMEMLEQAYANSSDDDEREVIKAQMKQAAETMETLNYVKPKETKETIAEKVKALSKLRELQEFQKEQAVKSEKEMQAAAKKASQNQKEIDEGNSDLLVILESIEEMEGEEKTEDGKHNSEDDSSEMENIGSEEAARYGASVIKKELSMMGTVDDIAESGHEKLSTVNETMNIIYGQMEKVYDMLEDDSFYDDEVKKIVLETASSVESMVQSNIGRMYDLKEQGLQQIKNARIVKKEHESSTHLIDANRAKEQMQADAIANTIRQTLQATVGKYSDELSERVEEKIDERNNVKPIEKEIDEEII